MNAQQQTDSKVHILWELVVHSCNRVLDHAHVYGFRLMDIPDPNINQIAELFDVHIIPLLDKLAREHEFSPESGIKIANIKQYTLHLRAITLAISNDDHAEFERIVDLLKAEPMLV